MTNQGRYIPQQGDIVFLNHSPTEGKEKFGKRPALVVSCDLLSKKSVFMWTVPITTGGNKFVTHVSLDNRTKTCGEIHVEQIRSYDYMERKPKYIEKCPSDILKRVTDIIGQLTSIRL